MLLVEMETMGKSEQSVKLTGKDWGRKNTHQMSTS